MISSSSFFSLLMMVFASGGGSDLLDFVPTEPYFKASKIEQTVPALTALLEAPLPAEAAARPGDSARRQLALRALGELKDPAALPAIEKAMASGDPLVADYARAARAAIKGEEFVRRGVSQEDLAVDLACLPSGVGVIGRFISRGGEALDLAKLMQPLVAGEGGPKPEEMQKEIVDGLGPVIAMLGNVRLGAVTFGVASEIGPDAGFVVLIMRGSYDHKAAARALGGRNGGVGRKAGGLTYFELESDTAYACPVSDEVFVLVAGASGDRIPLAEVGTKLSAGGGDFAIGKNLAKMLDGIDRKAPVWALMEVSDAYRQVPFLAPFDTLRLEGESDGKVTDLRLEGKGSDAAAVAGVVDELNAGLEKAREEVAKKKDFPPSEVLKPLLKATVIAADGVSASLRTRLDGDGAQTILPMMLFWGYSNDPVAPRILPDGPHEVPRDPAVEPVPHPPKVRPKIRK